MSTVAMPLMVALPMLFTVLILIIGKFWRYIGPILGVACAAATFYLSLLLITAPDSVYQMGGWIPPIGIVMVLDGLSRLMLLVVNLLAFLVIIYSISYMNRYTAQTKFYALFLLMLTGMNGVVLSGDLFNLFVFTEIASLASYALVGFGVESEELEAGFKYLILGSLASTAILFGVAIVYNLTGTVNMADAANMINAIKPNTALVFAIGMFIFGFALKSGLVPFHAWLPDAHPSAPAPVSAMLSGVLIKALGIYAITRVAFSVFNGEKVILDIILWFGLISAFVGGMLSIGQDDIKRLLAFSSISQVGYIAMGIGIGTPAGIAAALFHLFNHAVFKGLLFLDSGAIEMRTGTRDMRQMGGLMKRMPVTSLSTVIGSLSISGFPPFNGFFSKLLIIIALFQAKAYLFAGVAIFVSFITLAYYVKVQKQILFGPLPKVYSYIKEVPISMTIPLITLSVICLAAGIFYGFLNNALFYPATQAVLNQAKYISMVLGIGG